MHRPSGPGALSVEAFHSAIAGVVEASVLLALPMALGWRARWPWPVTMALLTALRISFHVYYGWTSLFVVPWIAFVPYRWRQVLWLFAVGHGSFDLLGLEIDGPANTQRAASAFFDVAVGAGAALGTYVLLSRIRSGDDRLGCPRSQSRRAVRVGEAPALVTADDRSPSFGHRVLG